MSHTTTPPRLTAPERGYRCAELAAAGAWEPARFPAPYPSSDYPDLDARYDSAIAALRDRLDADEWPQELDTDALVGPLRRDGVEIDREGCEAWLMSHSAQDYLPESED